MNDITTINPDDARLTRQLVHESQAATAAYESTRIRNICIGTGAVVLATGIGLAALVWAWGQGVDPEALKAALANMPPLKVETTVKNGEVTLKNGGEVAVKEGGKVTVDGNVGIEPGSVVKVEVPVPVELPDIKSQPKPNEAIQRRVTVFTEVPWRGALIVTGWEFATGDSKHPQKQYCYWKTLTTQATEHVVHLTEDGVDRPVKRSELADAAVARTKCVWWKGGV